MQTFAFVHCLKCGTLLCLYIASKLTILMGNCNINDLSVPIFFFMCLVNFNQNNFPSLLHHLFFSLMSRAVKRLIAINRIQNKSLCFT